MNETFEPEVSSSVCVNGSRQYGRPMETHRLVEIHGAGIIKDLSIKTVYVGGALGIDTVMLKTLRAFREKLKAELPYLIVVCPCTIAELPEEARAVAERCADRIIELENRITVEDKFSAFFIRNEYMVDRVRKIKAMTTDTDMRSPSGTMAAVRYAKRTGKDFEVVQIPAYKKGVRIPAPPFRG